MISHARRKDIPLDVLPNITLVSGDLWINLLLPKKDRDRLTVTYGTQPWGASVFIIKRPVDPGGDPASGTAQPADYTIIDLIAETDHETQQLQKCRDFSGQEDYNETYFRHNIITKRIGDFSHGSPSSPPVPAPPASEFEPPAPAPKEPSPKRPKASSRARAKNVRTELVSYQRPVQEHLLRLGKAYFEAVRWQANTIQPRFIPLIVGPTGVGKTFLVSTLQHPLKAHLLEQKLVNWLILGSRAETPTLQAIYAEILQHERTILFLDEIDKAEHASDSWSRMLQVEVFDLLDRKVQVSAIDHHLGKEREDREKAIEQLRRKLREQVFIVGAGTWQASWNRREKPKSMGFSQIGRDVWEAPRTLAVEDLKGHVAEELLHRFNQEVLYMPPPTREDYAEAANEIARRLPRSMAGPFLEAVEAELDDAVQEGIGFRLFENITTRLYTQRPAHAARASRSEAVKDPAEQLVKPRVAAARRKAGSGP